MKNRWLIPANVLALCFAGLAIVFQWLHSGSQQKISCPSPFVAQSFASGNRLARISSIYERTGAVSHGDGNARYLDLVLPMSARIFMPEMTGITNADRSGYYYYMSYYLFPREVAVTLDQPRFTAVGFQGRSSESNEELLTNGFDVRVDIAPDANTKITVLHQIAAGDPSNPGWFDSRRDVVIACLLPLLTALAGTWLLRFLFCSLTVRMPVAEQLACGLGLGMMAVAALTLGVKLCGWHGRGWVLALTAAGALAELWRDRKVLGNGMVDGFRRMVSEPLAVLIIAAGLAVFLILFRLAGLLDVTEFDALANWMFKAKIFFLCTGHEIVGWFSNPRLAYAHLDYPTLVPSLHAATYDSIGHVDEFVTKFWPTWMLLFLLLALASLSRGKTARFQAPLFFLLGVLLLPFTQAYVQMEGGTLPMVFFTVLGFVQCTIGLVERDRVRLGLGLTLLFGAAMSKFEGIIFLALTAGWMLAGVLICRRRGDESPGAALLTSCPTIKPSSRLWRVLAFCFLSALPFLWLRAQIPASHPESGWAGYALAHPGITFSSAPKIFLVMLARLFVNPGFASWSAMDGQLHWSGQWDGVSSLYNHMTVGLAWVGLLMTILLWLAMPARRPIILWTLAVFLSAMMVMSVVFACLVNIYGLNVMLEWINDNVAGRYLFPILLAWVATMVVLFFGDSHRSASNPNHPTVSIEPSGRKESGLESAKT